MGFRSLRVPLRLELSGLPGDPESYPCGPSAAPSAWPSLSPPLSPLFLCFPPSGSEQAFLLRGVCCGRKKGEGGLLKTIQPGNEAVQENPASRTSCWGEEGVLLCLVLKETDKTLSIICIMGLYSTSNINYAFCLFCLDSLYNP